MARTPHEASPQTDEERSPLDRLKRRFVYGLVFGVLVVIGVTLLGDGPALIRTLRTFDWWVVPPIILLTLVNYALRFAKWHLYLQWLDIGRLRPRTSLGIFLAGLSMAITPGKLGEFLKSYLLRRATSTPLSVSAPAVFAERVTDGISMLALAALGLVSVRYGWQVLAILAVLALAGILMLQSRSLMFRIFTRLEHLPIINRRMHALHVLYENTYLLFRPGKLCIAVGIGMVSWFGECAAFFLILIGLGFEPTLKLLVVSTFIMATASLLGAVSMLPGGLGAAEAGVAGLLLLIVRDPRMTSDLAAAATLLVRFATLWLGVLVGTGALLVIERHLTRLEESRPAADAAQTAS